MVGHQEKGNAMSSTAEQDGTTDDEGLRAASTLARALFGKLLIVSHDAGSLLGRETAYRDLLAELTEMREAADEALKRSPKSELVLAEIMALQKLISHFTPAPEFFAHKGDERTDSLRDYCEHIGLAHIADGFKRSAAKHR
jgi:hypothetical protein